MAAHSVVRNGVGAVAAGTDEQRGITLIESLIALAIIAGGVLGIAMMLVNGMVQQRTAATQSAANTLLADGFETLQVAPLLPPATAAGDIAAWRGSVALTLPGGTAGAAASIVAPLVLADGSSAQALQLSFASAGRSTDTTLDVLAVTTAWPAGGP
jgi:Tfp pilus assembly protein PilV